MLKNYKDLKVSPKRHRWVQKNVEGANKVFRKQSLESLTPWFLGPSSPTELEKKQNSIINNER
jgi:antibiotic biosynthesis monooxygenase (ABM) superfamily enzyme